MLRRKPLSARRAWLARSVKRERICLGWTQERTAEKAGLNLPHYQKIEEGVMNATLRTLEGLCEAFGVEVEELFGV
jgi:transcriptional regulator with XRE-family HTH domain